ncbi:hypothetical protein JMJ77_0006451, partial [Colletotrichum scovillei]
MNAMIVCIPGVSVSSPMFRLPLIVD